MKYTKLTIKISAKPPYFMGSQIRGAFGYALKKVVCVNPSFKCEGCFAVNDCLYFDFYEKKNNFHKYRLDYKLGESEYHFSIFLFEEVANKLPYVIAAFNKMITEIGFGQDRKTYKEFEMFVNDESVYKNGNFNMPQKYIKRFECDSFGNSVLLRFVTPLRIKKDNKFIRDRELVTIFDIINSIFQRKNSLENREFTKLPFEVKSKIVENSLNYKTLTRLSNRQKTKMNLDGLIGDMIITDLSEEEYKLLKLGEIIGVGKQVTFGLGKIEVKELL